MSDRSMTGYKRLTKLEWGSSTKDEKGAGRRIVVYGVPPQATLDDFKAFFGPVYSLDGITILPHRELAFVQYNRPKDATNAVSKNGERFMGYPIKIKPYEVHNRSRKDNQRTRSRSRSISPFVDPEPIDVKEPTGETSPEPVNVSPTKIYERERDEEMERALREFNSRNRSMENPGVIPLPDDIDLTLRLVIAQRTASNLSMHQIQSIILYFIEVRDSTKQIAPANLSPFKNPIFNEQQAQFQFPMQTEQQVDSQQSRPSTQQTEAQTIRKSPVQQDEWTRPSDQDQPVNRSSSQVSTKSTLSDRSITQDPEMTSMVQKIRKALGK